MASVWISACFYSCRCSCHLFGGGKKWNNNFSSMHIQEVDFLPDLVSNSPIRSKLSCTNANMPAWLALYSFPCSEESPSLNNGSTQIHCSDFAGANPLLPMLADQAQEGSYDVAQSDTGTADLPPLLSPHPITPLPAVSPLLCCLAWNLPRVWRVVSLTIFPGYISANEFLPFGVRNCYAISKCFMAFFCDGWPPVQHALVLYVGQLRLHP